MLNIVDYWRFCILTVYFLRFCWVGNKFDLFFTILHDFLWGKRNLIWLFKINPFIFATGWVLMRLLSHLRPRFRHFVFSRSDGMIMSFRWPLISKIHFEKKTLWIFELETLGWKIIKIWAYKRLRPWLVTKTIEFFD